MAVISFMVTYIFILITQMESGAIDQVKNIVMKNQINEEGGRNNLKLTDYNFMPVLEIDANTPFDTQDHLDVWDGSPKDRVFNLEKFFDHVTFVFLQRIRDYSISSMFMVQSQNLWACTE